MSLRSRFRIALLAILIPAALQAATGISFSRITVDKGLSNNYVGTICQDIRGNIWLGTNDGINLYNGYNVVVFKHIPGDESSLPSNIINYLYRDRQDRIWACTANGLAWFDTGIGAFRRVEIEGTHSVEIIAQLADDIFLLCTRNNSYYYNSVSGELRPCLMDGKRIRFYAIDERNGYFLAGTMEKSVELLRFENGELRRKRSPIPTVKNTRRVLFADEQHCWVASTRGELMFIDLVTGEKTWADWMSRPEKYVSALQYDDRGRLWIGSDNKLLILDFTSRSSIVLESVASDQKSLSHQSIRSIFRDNSGGMWVGTEFGGVNYWSGRDERFSTLKLGSGEFSDKVVTSLCMDADSSLWVGSHNDGLIHYYPESGKKERYDIGNIHSIYCAPDGKRVFVGSVVKGWSILDKTNGTIRRFPSPSDVNAILGAGNGNLWFGCLSGLYLYNDANCSYRRMSLPAPKGLSRILTLFQDFDGHLWIGAKESLREYEIGEDYSIREIPHPELDNLVQIQCIFETADSVMWIGCADGLFRFRPGAGLLHISEPEALARTTIKGIEQDGEGMLWISTDNGLTRYNPATGEHRAYYYEDGLQSNQFSAFSSHCKDVFGKMYFGGIGGVTVFSPGEIEAESRTVAPEITGLQLFNRDVRPGDDSGILSEDISVAKKITLSHRQNSIVITFACPDFASEGRNRFLYKMEGFDRDWIQARNMEASYHFTKKGDYRFLLKAANKDGVWDSSVASLQIKVLPVWYKTRIAKLLFLLLLLTLIVAGEYRLYSKIEARNQEKLRKAESEYEEKMRRARILSYAVSPYILTRQNEEFLFGAIDFIEGNINNPQFSVEMLAERAGMTRMNLYRKLKTLTGLSPVELVKKIRIEKACSLIKESSYSIAEIGSMTGYNSPSYFNTAFKKELGCTPGEYAAANKSGK